MGRPSNAELARRAAEQAAAKTTENNPPVESATETAQNEGGFRRTGRAGMADHRQNTRRE